MWRYTGTPWPGSPKGDPHVRVHLPVAPQPRHEIPINTSFRDLIVFIEMPCVVFWGYLTIRS